MKTITFANGKGGVGKSTLATLLIEYLNHKEIPVELTDTDPNQTTQTWANNCKGEGRVVLSENAKVQVIDCAGTSGSALKWMKNSDLIVCPFKANFADLDLTILWFTEGLSERLKKKFVFVPNMLGRAKEQKRGIKQLVEVVEEEGVGAVLVDCALKARDAIYPDLFKGDPTNFFNWPAKYKTAQVESLKLCAKIVELLEV